jgi:medium-chain acyl-[acyl-carrier-protein] hydrolase
MTKWLWIPRPKPEAEWRLYCFPHAGAGASAFASWTAAAPTNIEIAAVQLPGRETRLDEEPLHRFAPAAQSVAEMIQLDDRPFAQFGHSAGGKLAVHVASVLEQTDRRPAHLFVSSSPMKPVHKTPIHHLDDADFVRSLADHYGPLPEPIMQDPELWALFARVLRADFEALEMETLAPTPLDIPLTVIEAKQDMVVTSDQLEGWQAWSRHHIHRETIDADHFSYRKQPRPYLGIIERYLRLDR